MWLTINETLSNFCSSPFWDNNLTWNSLDPDFTECFEKTILVWLPCAFLWLLLPLEVFFLRRTNNKNIPFNSYNISKLVIISSLIVMTLLDVFVAGNHSVVDFYASIIKVITFVLFFCLTYINVKRGVRLSETHSLFSFMLLICSIPEFRTTLRSFYNKDKAIFNGESTNPVLCIIYFALVVAIFFLNVFFTDAPPISKRQTIEQTYSTFNADDDSFALNLKNMNCESNKKKNISPEFESASLVSRLYLSWFSQLAWKGYQKTLKNEDLWDLDHEMETAQLTRRFESQWYSLLDQSEKKLVKAHSDKGTKNETEPLLKINLSPSKKQKASIVRPLIRMYGLSFLFVTIFKIMSAILGIANSQILNLILAFVQYENKVLWHGYFYAFLLLVNTLADAIIFNNVFYYSQRWGIQINTALMQTIYKKALRISNGARRESTLGEILNLMAVDARVFLRFAVNLPEAFAASVSTIIVMYILLYTLGPCVLVGIAMLIVCFFVIGVIASRVERQQQKQMRYSDERIKFTNETFAGIRILKLYACESSFEEKVIQIRNKEIEVLKISAYLQGIVTFVTDWSPFLVSFVTFGLYVLVNKEHVLDARVTFVSLTLLNLVKHNVKVISYIFKDVIEASVAIKRINKFLNSEELSLNAVLHKPRVERIVIENGEFSWDSPNGQSVLSNISVKVNPGNLVAVIGQVGSGKSSLLSAILGEIYVKSGFVNTTGSLAYVPQQAWIRNVTLKNNITFGLRETEKNSFYDKILEACALIPDLEILPCADQTEIGEKGINLSGGQKQRVSLARAIYSEADTYLLDDPLSAVDAHVGKHIFEKVIGPNGLLKEKTRIFVTHNLTFLSQVDYIIILENGMISESGTYQELMKKGGNIFACLAKKPENCEERIVGQEIRVNERVRPCNEKSVENSATKKKQSGALTEKEGMKVGSIEWSVIKFYLRAIGQCTLALIVSTNLITRIFFVTPDFWLSAWSSNSRNTNATNSSDTLQEQCFYLTVYALLGVGQAISILTQTVVFYKGILEAAKRIHDHLLNAVLHWPAMTFDKIPLGRIMNRFSFDVNALDKVLPFSLQETFSSTLRLFASLFVISYNTPLFLSVFLPIGIAFHFLRVIYVATSKQIKRLESVSKSPIFSHFSDSISGAHSIRAYGLQTLFIEASENKINNNVKSFYLFNVGNRWLSTRLKLLTSSIIFCTALFSLLAKDTLSAALIGLSLTYAFEVIGLLHVLIGRGSDLENNIVSIERIKEYIEIEHEAPWEVPHADKFVSRNWPDKGEIVFKNFQTRYREDLELVLKELTITVKGGDKVGVVGRTGAGKSSLALSLFRIIESSGGSIFIDGVDVSKIGLRTLRSRLTIIPQDPTLFSGTLRMNLNLMGDHEDEDIWKVLELTNMKTFVRSLNGGLEYKIEEGGMNLSVGQRQLICLARALLRKTKVLILDEATASVDIETDNFIQAVIRKEFSDCTVLTIAHRLNTILDYDRVMVLNEGRIVEFDSPKKLLALKQSIFASMAMDANLA